MRDKFLAVSLVLLGACHRSGAPVAEVAASAPTATADMIRYPPGAPQLEMIRAQAVARSAVPSADVLNARVAYDEDRTARIAVSYAGRIVAIKAAPGDTVKAGQVLAEIDSPDVGTALADAYKAHADEARKRQAVERARDLVNGAAVSQRDWESLQADLALAHAETVRAQQRLKNLNPGGAVLAGERVRLVSPIAGVLTERTATPALEVGPTLAAPLFVVTDPQRLWLMIDVPEKALGRLEPGQALEVRSDAYPDERFAARVARVGSLVDANTRRVTTRATVANPDRKLLPEMFVRAQPLARTGTAIRIANSALVTRGLYSYVYIESAAGEYRRRRVDLSTQGGDDSIVGAGLEAGERVVVQGALLLDADLATRTGDAGGGGGGGGAGDLRP